MIFNKNLIIYTLSGSVCKPLGALFESSREPLGPSWGLLGASRGLLGASRTISKAMWKLLGAFWEAYRPPLERLQSVFEASWDVLEPFWQHFGSFRGILGSILMLGKRLPCILLRYWKTLKNSVRYCKNRGSEDKKALEIRAKINLESVFKAKKC